MQLGRQCATLQLDRRVFCLSTLPMGTEIGAMGIVMWQRLSLRSRINLLLALVLTLGLAINVARLVLEAGPRVQAEDQSVTRLAREFVETIVAGLSEAPDPEARLDQIVRDLKRLRHVSITRQTDASAPADPREEDDDARSVPEWFVTLVHPRTTSVSVPIPIPGKSTALVITSIPNDEIAEIWDGILTQLAIGSAVALALLLITMIVVGRALAPLEALSQAMSGIESGSYSVHVEPGGAPELAAICTKMNHLAETLGEAVEDKRRLAERAVSLQDREREEIARELHDEFGPYLFALRVNAGALMRLAKTGAPDPDGSANMVSRFWSRSTISSNSRAGSWRGCGLSGSPNSDCAKRSARCCGCGTNPIPRSKSKQRFQARSAKPEKPPT